MSDDEEAKQRFIREAKAASALDHPNICTIYEIGETDEGQLFIAMAYYEGETLHRKISRGPLPVDEVVEIVRQIAAGLAKSHDRDIIHRDVKPANVFVTLDGQVKILDFGLAKILGEGVTLTGLAQGTPAYMAPERIRNEKASPRTDLWSLGVLIYEALAGRRPFTGANVAQIIESVHRHEPEDLRQIRPEVPPRLAAIVRRLLQKNPRSRYRRCGALLRDLEALNPTASGAWPQDSGPRIEIGFLPRPLTALVTRGWPVLAVLLVLAAALIPRSDESPPVAERLSLAILPFEVPSGDPDLDWSLAQRMSVSMEHSRRAQVLSVEKVHRIVQELGGPKVFFDSRTALLDLARQAEADLVLVGRITETDNRLRIDIRLRDGKTGDDIFSTVQGDVSSEDLLKQVDTLSSGIQQHIEVPDRVAGDPELDREKVALPSEEAWGPYSIGMKLHFEYNEAAAAEVFERAVEIDPRFAMAWAKLATVQRNLNRPQWIASAERALEHVEALTPRERMYIEGIYASKDIRTWPRAIELLEQAVKEYPDHYSAHQNLALMFNVLERYDKAISHGEFLVNQRAPNRGITAVLAESYAGRGDFDRAEALLRAASQKQPEDVVAQIVLGRLYLRMGRFDDALASFAAAEAISAVQPTTLEGRCNVHLLRGDWLEALALAEHRFKEPALRAVAGRCRVLVDIARGHPDEALAHAEKLVAHLPPGVLSASMRLTTARIHLLRGDAGAALEEAEAARQEGRGYPHEMWALFLAARAEIELGDGDDAGRRAAELLELAEAAASDQGRRLHRHLLGLLALERGATDEAVAELEEAARQLPERGLLVSYHEPDHVPLWFSLARAYEAAEEFSKAAASRKKILDATEERLYHPELYVRSLYLLGKYHEARGEKGPAREYFDQFQSYWSREDLSQDWLARLPL